MGGRTSNQRLSHSRKSEKAEVGWTEATTSLMQTKSLISLRLEFNYCLFTHSFFH